MGALEAIDILFTHLTALASLGVAIASFYQSEPKPPAEITFTHGNRCVTVRAVDPESLRQLTEFLSEAERLSEEDSDG